MLYYLYVMHDLQYSLFLLPWITATKLRISDSGWFRIPHSGFHRSKIVKKPNSAEKKDKFWLIYRVWLLTNDYTLI